MIQPWRKECRNSPYERWRQAMEEPVDSEQCPSTALVSLLLLGLFVSAVNTLWILNDARPPHWDAAIHLISSLGYDEILRRPELSFVEKMLLFMEVDGYYPPFVAFLTALGNQFFPSTPDGAVIFNAFYIFVLIFSVYGIAITFMDRASALLAVTGLLSFPILTVNTRDYMLDIPVTAFVALAVYLLMKSRSYASFSWSFLFGVVSGVGMLTKWTFLFFVFPLYLYYFIGAMACKEGRGKRGRNFIMVTLLIAFISAPWYLNNLVPILLSFGRWGFETGVAEGDPPVFTLNSLIYYPLKINEQALLPWFLLFLGGIVMTLARGKKPSAAIWLWLVGPYIIFTLLRNKDPRYTLPMLPAVAMVGAYGLSKISCPNLKRGLILLVALYSITSILWFSFGSSAFRLGSHTTLFDASPPDNSNWMVERTFETILKDSEGRETPPKVRILPDHFSYNKWIYKYETRRDGLPLDIHGVTNFPIFSDYVVIKSGDQGGSRNSEAAMAKVESGEISFEKLFEKIDEFPLPDGSVGTIYKRAPQPIEGKKAKAVIKYLEANIQSISEEYVREGQGIKIKVLPHNEVKSRKGEFKSITVSFDSALVGDYPHGGAGVPVRNFAFTAKDIDLSLYRIYKDKKIEPLGIRSVQVKGELLEGEIKEFIEKNARDLTDVGIEARGGVLRASATLKNLNLPVKVGIRPLVINGGSNIFLKIDELKILGIPLPSIVGQFLIKGFNPVIHRLPLKLELEGIDIDEGKITIR